MGEVISVVVPVYNVERYLDQCIQSIVNQSYTNLEIILVDDGSTDSCPQMCDAWAEKDARIRVIHKKNAGLGMARNTGIEHAAGKYICFFDSDDFVDVHILEKAYNVSEQENSDLTIFGATRVCENGMIRKVVQIKTTQTVFRGNEVQEILLPAVIDSSDRYAQVKGLRFSMCVYLFSMDLIRRTSWRVVSERNIISEDSFSLLQLYKYVNCAVVLPENGYFYRMNPKSLTQVYRTDRFEKTKKFYLEARELCAAQGYSQKVMTSLRKMLLGFMLGIMKQLTVTDMPFREKLRQIRQIVLDDCVQEIAWRIPVHNCNLKVKTVVMAMRCRMILCVYFAAILQARYEKRKNAV